MLSRIFFVQAQQFIEEPWTHAKFEGHLERSVLLGVGLRSKFGLVSVYAYGFYIEPEQDSPRKTESKLVDAIDGYCQTQNGSQRLANDALWQQLIEYPSNKTIVLEMQRKITGDDFKMAFDDSLGSRIGSAEGREALAEFAGAFAGHQLATGKRVTFNVSYAAASGQASVETILDGSVLSSINSSELAEALLDVYLGKDPVSSQGKMKFAEDLPSFVQRSKVRLSKD